MYRVSEPRTPQEFEAYYALRYTILRKPWNQPEGSERDLEENTSIHAFIRHEGKVLGVCRLQMNTPYLAQLRYMAVAENQQGKGLGKLLMQYMEQKAKEKGATEIILQARENAVEFYKACGYEIVEKSHLLWGQIQHYLMQKEL